MVKTPSKVGVGKVTLSDEQEKNAKIIEDAIDLALEVEDAGSEEYTLEFNKENEKIFYKILCDERVLKHLEYIYSVAGWIKVELKVKPTNLVSVVTLRR